MDITLYGNKGGEQKQWFVFLRGEVVDFVSKLWSKFSLIE